MSVQEIQKNLDNAILNIKTNILKTLEIETALSISMNFEAEGRPAWTPSKKRGKAKGTKTLRITSKMSKVSVVKDIANSRVVIFPNPLARAYSRIHQEGGVINHPGNKLKFVKNKSGKTVFGKSSRKRGVVKEVKGRPYQIEITQRLWMVIPPVDFPRIISNVAKAAKL